MSAPDLLFIVPFRDRELQLSFFRRHMKYILEDCPHTYEIVVVHQQDERPFNRGGMKNIGALYARQKWLDAYPTMTLVFNDVDTIPVEKGLIDYKTTPGFVKHFYGFTYTLGGIVSICGGDLDACGGFPNLWAWGYEDNALQQRCISAGLVIERDPFFPVFSKHIIQLPDGQKRQMNRVEYNLVMQSNADTMYDLHQIQYDEIHETSFPTVAAIESLKTTSETITINAALSDITWLHVHFFMGRLPIPTTFDSYDLLKPNSGSGRGAPHKRKSMQYL